MQTSATRIGRAHRLMGQNCQDFACTGEPERGFCFGIVADGCGSKYREGELVYSASSEVGARLLGAFASTYLNQHLLPECGDDDQLKALLEGLYNGCLRFLNGLLKSLPLEGQHARARFAATHLLSTLVGYVKTPRSASFFWSGDGYLCHDGHIRTLDSGNRPHYLVYQLLTDEHLCTDQEAGFHTVSVPARTRWLAVATDGWSQRSLEQLAIPRPGLSLQRWLNIQARERGKFDDDAAVAVWHREPA